jgi:hypothetical protein
VFRLLQYIHTGVAEVIYFNSSLKSLTEIIKPAAAKQSKEKPTNKHLNFKLEEVSKIKK